MLWAPAVVALALGVLVAAHWEPLLHGDASADRAVHGAAAGHPAYASALKWITDVLQPLSWRLAGLAAAATLALLRRFRPAVYLVAVAVVGGLVSSGLKDLVDRPRPHWVHPVLTAGGASWPSGHALASAAGAASLALTLSLVLGQTTPRRGARKSVLARPQNTIFGPLGRKVRPLGRKVGPLGRKVGPLGRKVRPLGKRPGTTAARWAAAGLCLLALLVGASRVLLGVHYPSDVVSGWALGLLVAGLLARLLGVPRRGPAGGTLGTPVSETAGGTGETSHTPGHELDHSEKGPKNWPRTASNPR
jgi:undecaprenyl-diphosphatase